MFAGRPRPGPRPRPPAARCPAPRCRSRSPPRAARVVRGGERRLELPGVRAQRERPGGQDLCDRRRDLRPVAGGNTTRAAGTPNGWPLSVVPGPAAPRLVTGPASGIVQTCHDSRSDPARQAPVPRRVAVAGHQTRRPEATRRCDRCSSGSRGPRGRPRCGARRHWRVGRAGRRPRRPGRHRPRPGTAAVVPPAGRAGRADHVALTFDDGPDPACTPAFLDLLADAAGARHVLPARLDGGRGARARRGDRRRRAMRSAVHGWDHRYTCCAAPGRCATTWPGPRTRWPPRPAPQPRFYRPPYGVLSAGALAAARRLGLTPVLWTCWGREWTPGATARVGLRDARREPGGRRHRPAARLRLHVAAGLRGGGAGRAAPAARRMCATRPRGWPPRRARPGFVIAPPQLNWVPRDTARLDAGTCQRPADVVPWPVKCLGRVPHLVHCRRVETLRRRSGCLQGHGANWNLRLARVTVRTAGPETIRSGSRYFRAEVMMMAESQGNGHDSPERDSAWQPPLPRATTPAKACRSRTRSRCGRCRCVLAAVQNDFP